MKSSPRWALIALAIPAGIYLFPKPFLLPLGSYLIKTDDPAKCDCLFVLAGDSHGQRIMHAAELFRAGLAPKVFVSGPEGNYGFTEDELAIPFAKKNGAGDVPFVGWPNKGKSTISEGRQVFDRLKEAGCRSVLVVTSDYHTRRAGNILRRVWPGIDIKVAAASTVEYDVNTWWNNRQYQKTFFFEWTKTVADWIGL